MGNGQCRAVPAVIKVLAWLWILGAVWKLGMTYFSWAQFEVWRSVFLLLMKLGGLGAGILLLRGYRQGAVLYLLVTALTTAVFYAAPPAMEGIEAYFTPAGLAAAIAVPLVYLGVIGFHWKRLVWQRARPEA